MDISRLSDLCSNSKAPHIIEDGSPNGMSYPGQCRCGQSFWRRFRQDDPIGCLCYMGLSFVLVQNEEFRRKLTLD